MKYKIELFSNWRSKAELHHPGVYRVPEDMSDETAQLAIKDGGAQKVERHEKFKKAEQVFPRKRGTQDNKKLDAAPENKSEVE